MQICNKQFSPYNNECHIFTAPLYYRMCILCYIYSGYCTAMYTMLHVYLCLYCVYVYSGIVIHLTGDMHASLSRTEQVIIPLIMQTSPQLRFISVLMHDFMMPSTYSRTIFSQGYSFLCLYREPQPKKPRRPQTPSTENPNPKNPI